MKNKILVTMLSIFCLLSEIYPQGGDRQSIEEGLSQRDDIVFFGDGDTLRLIDVSDFQNHVEISNIGLLSKTMSGIYVSGDYVYVANHNLLY